MNSIWNKNLAAFLNRFPALGEIYKIQINQISIQSSQNDTVTEFPLQSSIFKLSVAKNGSVTGEENNIRLHSSYNPEREAQQAADKILESRKKSVAFLGFGLGYHVCALAAKINENQEEYKNLKLIIIEPDPLHFFEALKLLDWTEVFKLPQLILAVGCPLDSVIPLLENQEHVNIGGEGVSSTYFFSLPAFTNHNQGYFDSVKTLINRNKTKNEINAATYDKFAKLWIKNSIKNLDNLCKCKKISDFAGNKVAENAILVAAGPSLEKILPFLKELKKSCLIVCVETALRACLQQKVQPDFIIITDPQYWAYRHIAGLHSPESILVCPLSVYPSVFRFDCKEIVLCSDMFPVSQFYEKNTGGFGDLGAGGSVASSAWNLCYLLGVQNIYLAGLDLSFPSKQTHIKGSSAEQTFHTISNKLLTAEKSTCRSMYSAVPEYGENYKGQKVLTDSRMKMFAWWFESRIDECKEIKTYTLCKESLKIPGVVPWEVEDLLNNKHSIDRRKIYMQTPAVTEQKQFETLKSDFEAELKTLRLLIDAAVEKCMINGPDLQKELSAIEAKIRENQLYEIVRLAMPSEKYLETHRTEPAALAVYEKLQKAIKLYICQ